MIFISHLHGTTQAMGPDGKQSTQNEANHVKYEQTNSLDDCDGTHCPFYTGKLKKKDLKSEARLCYLVRFYLKRSLIKLNERRKKPTTLLPNILNCLGGHFEDRVLFQLEVVMSMVFLENLTTLPTHRKCSYMRNDVTECYSRNLTAPQSHGDRGSGSQRQESFLVMSYIIHSLATSREVQKPLSRQASQPQRLPEDFLGYSCFNRLPPCSPAPTEPDSRQKFLCAMSYPQT